MAARTIRLSVLLLVSAAAYAQSDAGVSLGRGLFRSNCAFCHGLTAEGGRGPNLVAGPSHHGETDSDVRQVIRNGAPGTTMPAFTGFTDDEVDNLVIYLRSLSQGTVKRQTVPGDARLGEAVYVKNGCAGCHRIGNDGSVYGPDLTRIGASRSIEYLKESLVHPSADIQPDYEGVTAVTKEGKRISGMRINEDNFTLQLRTPGQEFVCFEKEDLREVVYPKDSLMPAFERLAPADLENLIAYLATLTGPASGARKQAEATR